MNLISYTRVSTSDQHESGLGLDSQRTLIQQYAVSHGHTITETIEDVASGAKQDREGFVRALSELKNGNAGGIVVAKLDRLTRSLLHFAEIVETAKRQDWVIIVADGGFDMATPTGKAMAGMLAVFAELERDMIGQRTKDALAAKRTRLGGSLPGTRPSLPEALRSRLRAMRGQGMSLREIAETLDAEGVPTSQNGRWQAGTVAYILK